MHEKQPVDWKRWIEALRRPVPIPVECAEIRTQMRCDGCDGLSFLVHSPLVKQAAAIRFYCPECCPACNRVLDEWERWSLTEQAREDSERFNEEYELV